MSHTNLNPVERPVAARPGQMTAVMRAMPQVTGPKVLRIGLVQGGKVIEERVIKQRTHVTIGPSEKSMFVIPSKNIPPSFRLFEPDLRTRSTVDADRTMPGNSGRSSIIAGWPEPSTSGPP